MFYYSRFFNCTVENSNSRQFRTNPFTILFCTHAEYRHYSNRILKICSGSTAAMLTPNNNDLMNRASLLFNELSPFVWSHEVVTQRPRGVTHGREGGHKN